MNTLISVAMITYNGEKYIRKQLDSILRQSYENFELVICDDASYDTTGDILQEYERKDSRVHVYQNKTNLGVTKNIEKAIGLCKGDYVALSDQDDIWTDDHLEVLINSIGDNLLCAGNAEIIDKFDMTAGIVLVSKHTKKLCNTNKRKIIRILCCRNPYQGGTVLIHSRLFKEAIPVPSGVIHDTWFALCALIQNKFYYIDKVVNQYRLHDNNVTGNTIEKSKTSYIHAPEKSPYKYKSIREYVNNIFRKAFITRKMPDLLLGDRLYHCNALLERYPSMIIQNRKLIEFSIKCYNCESNIGFRLSLLLFVLANYGIIFNDTSIKNFFKRMIRFIIYTNDKGEKP